MSNPIDDSYEFQSNRKWGRETSQEPSKSQGAGEVHFNENHDARRGMGLGASGLES